MGRGQKSRSSIGSSTASRGITFDQGEVWEIWASNDRQELAASEYRRDMSPRPSFPYVTKLYKSYSLSMSNIYISFR